MTGPTAIQLIGNAIEQAKAEKAENCPPAAAREFSLTITHLEDAAMRFNRGVATKAEERVDADVQAELLARVNPDEYAPADLGSTS